MIQVQMTMPQGQLQELKDGNMIVHQTETLFAHRKIVMFAVPGAFTPTCSAAHLPGYVVSADELKARGVDDIICLSVNDAFVMHEWGQALNAENIVMLADGDGSYTRMLGLGKETGGFGGYRSQRYAMIIENGIVTHLNLEKPKEFIVSSAEVILESL